MRTVTDPATRMVSLTRAYLPLALVVLGLVVALIGAARCASGSTEVVHEIGQGSSTKRTTEATGSPLAFVNVGCVVALAGCALQALAWRMIPNRGGPREGEELTALAAAAHPRSRTEGQEPPRGSEVPGPSTRTAS